MNYIHTALPGVQIVYIEINKAPQKRDRWDIADKANALVKEKIDQMQTWHYVNVNPGMFDNQGQPRDDMFTGDGLHLYEKAYTEVWKPLVTEKLQPIWDSINAEKTKL